MTCRHEIVQVINPKADRVRCTRCHLTLRTSEVDANGCPECYEREGRRFEDFEPVEQTHAQPVYRCDACGALLGNNNSI